MSAMDEFEERTKASNELELLKTALELYDVKVKKKLLEEEEDRLQELLLLQQDSYGVDPEKIREVGIVYGERDNGFNDTMIPFLKQKGLRDCIRSGREQIDNRAVREAIDTGQLEAEEAAEFAKPKSRFYTLPRNG